MEVLLQVLIVICDVYTAHDFFIFFNPFQITIATIYYI